MLYVGGGVLNADACDELLELAEIGRLPVVTTLMAKSAFPETHELHFGWPGMHGPKWSNWASTSATCSSPSARASTIASPASSPPSRPARR